MRKLAFASILAALSLASTSCSFANNTAGGTQADSVANDTTAHLTLLFAGDMMQHEPQFRAARKADGTYDYSDYFRYVQDEVKEADVAIANLEVTLAGAPYSGYPQFCAPDAYAAAIKDAGFDLLLTNNNHSCDKGSKGIKRTIQVLDSLNIPHLGTYTDWEHRDKTYPYLLEAKGFKIALLTYTYGTNGLPVPKPHVVNLIDTVQIRKDIEKARAMKPDLIIAFMHWGTEYVLQPVASQKWQADWLLANGVDHVIGGHPHVVEPIEMRQDSKGNKHLVAWSLGNFVSNQQKPNTNGGLMLRLQLEKDSTVRVANCDYSLIWVSRPPISGKRTHRVYPVDIDPTLINATERQQRDNFVNTARNLFKKYNKGVEERKK